MAEQVRELPMTKELLDKSNSPVILFDLDRTLLNTQQLGVLVAGHFDEYYRSFGVVPGTFSEWNVLYKTEIGTSTHYELPTLSAHIHRQMTALAHQQEGEQTLAVPTVQEIEAELTAFIQLAVNECLYSDALETIRTLQARGCRICLFTQGVQAWQELKFAHSELSSLIEPELQFVSSDKASAGHLATIQEKLRTLGLDQRPVWLVDDKEEILQTARAYWPELRTFLIVRGSDQVSGDSNHSPESSEIINSLQALTEITPVAK